MLQEGETPVQNESDPRGQGGDLSLYTDEKRVKQDSRLAGRAVRERWPMEQGKRATLVRRLYGIAEKTIVDVPVKDGVYPSELHADQNAIAAARVLAQMEGQNQADEHLDDKNARLDSGQPTESVVFNIQPVRPKED